MGFAFAAVSIYFAVGLFMLGCCLVNADTRAELLTADAIEIALYFLIFAFFWPLVLWAD